MGYRINEFTNSIWQQLIAAVVYGLVVGGVVFISSTDIFTKDITSDILWGVLGTSMAFTYTLILLPFLAALLNKLRFFNRARGVLAAWILGGGSGLTLAIYVAIITASEPAGGWAILAIIPLAPLTTGVGLLLGFGKKKNDI